MHTKQKHNFIKRVSQLFLFLIGLIIFAYVILWLFSFKTYDIEYGVSFSPQYTRHLGLDVQETYQAIMTDIKPTHIRLALPWSQIEETQGQYDFSEVDSLIAKAGETQTKAVLVVGQKVPRWPECFIPVWAENLSKQEYKQKLFDYVQTSVQRYKDNPTIELWQVENEPFIRFPFGECALFDKTLIQDEINLVAKLDPNRNIVITDSGELSTWRKASWYGDILGTTLYRTTRTFFDIIIAYDWIPPAFYKIRARLWNNDQPNFFVSELQAEPWFSEGVDVRTADYTKEKTFSPERFAQNIEYTQKVGASRAYLWGVEWWYFMKKEKGDPRYWDFAKTLFDN